MIIDRRKLLAYRCPICGLIQYETFSVFNFKDSSNVNRLCNCKRSSIRAYKNKSGKFIFEIPCIICEDNHKVELTNRNLWISSINCVFCDKTNTEIAYIGDQPQVYEKIRSFEKEIDELINKLKYNDYFSNVRIMLEVLNWLHDLAEAGGLMCECGSSNIELNLLSDRVKVSCKECSISTFVFARTTQDLVSLYNSKYFYLQTNP